MSGRDTEALLVVNERPRQEFSYELSAELVTLTDVRPREAEAIRTIRTHIMNQHIRRGRRGLAVCAATPGVGCTFTAANLALSLAQVGVGTLLIDANMRQPQVDAMIRPESPSPGLVQCMLAEGGEPSDFIRPEIVPNLSVLFAGGIAEHPQELLAGEAFRRLLEYCLREYEFTILDTPPASLCADARRIGALVGYALIVARANVTRASEVRQMAHRLQEDDTQVIGTVLNEI